MSSSVCRYSSRCSGCSLWEQPYSQQLLNKQQRLQTGLTSLEGMPRSEIQIHSVAEYGFRDFVNFTIQDGRIGLYSFNEKTLVDLEECVQMSPALHSLYKDFRALKLPERLAKASPSEPFTGSFKLRVSPSGTRGLWLDFSNVDIKRTLTDALLMKDLSTLGLVEMGQRNKRAVHKPDGTWGLQDPELESWTQTWAGDKAIPLYGTVASFSQPGDLSNRRLIALFEEWIKPLGARSFAEFGCGSGNLTLPALARTQSSAAQLSAVYESSELALMGLQRTLKEQNNSDTLKIHHGDYQRRSLLAEKHDLLILNPPRSGIGEFLKDYKMGAQHIFYMSCHIESFLVDSKRLLALGYLPTQIAVVDQFPQTEHFEILSLWKH